MKLGRFLNRCSSGLGAAASPAVGVRAALSVPNAVGRALTGVLVARKAASVGFIKCDTGEDALGNAVVGADG